jgi:SOS-response transcriptional repressor LexA
MHYGTLIPEPRRRRHRPLTDRKRHILDVVYACTGEQGYPPTLAELADFLGCTTSTAQGHVDRLIRKGSLSRDGEGRRTLKIIDAEYMETNGPIAAAFLTDTELTTELERRGYTAAIINPRATTKSQRARRRKE